jgi:hypothetical protein
MSTTPQQIDLWRQAPSEHQRVGICEQKRSGIDRVVQADESIGGYRKFVRYLPFWA